MSEQYVLDEKSCAQVALYMYQEYKKAMQPPLFSVLTFEEWLQRIIERGDRPPEDPFLKH